MRHDSRGTTDEGKASNFPRPTPQRTAIVHPGSGGRAKCAPLLALEALVSALRAAHWRVTWMIGPDEVERDGPALIERLEKSAPVIFEESIERAADVVAEVDLFVGNDAGMTHVAALAEVATIAIFGPTDPEVWRPLGLRVRVVPFPDAHGLELWVEQLMQAADELVRCRE